MIPKSEWVYYGFPGHFIGGSKCAYHLATRIGKYLISTVGAYRPLGSGEYETLSVTKDSFFETMVFPCDGEDKYGNPNNELSEVEVVYYAKSIDAECGHRIMCQKYAEMQ